MAIRPQGLCHFCLFYIAFFIYIALLKKRKWSVAILFTCHVVTMLEKRVNNSVRTPFLSRSRTPKQAFLGSNDEDPKVEGYGLNTTPVL